MQLLPHQVATWNFYHTHPHAFDLSEYGTGKSQPALAYLRDIVPPHRLLIVAPSGVIHKWLEREIPAWGHREWVVADLTGAKRRRWKAFRRPHHVAIMNYEGVLVLGSALVGQYDALLLDEPHRLKNPAGKISRAIAFLARDARFCFGLTGSPILEHPTDLYPVMRAVDPTCWPEGFYKWRERLFLTAERGPGQPQFIAREGTMNLLQRELAARSIRHLRDDIQDVTWPRVLHRDPVVVDLDPQVRIAYDQMEREFQAALQDGRVVSAQHCFPRLQKLGQLVAGGYLRDGVGAPQRIGNATKVDALQDLFREIGRTGQAVVWSTQPYVIGLAQDALEQLKLRVKTIWGGTAKGDARDRIHEFNDRKIDVLIANPACIGEGNDLHGDYSVFLAMDWSHNHWSQPPGRFIRLTSQRHRVVFIDIVARNTIDTDIRSAIARKTDYLAEILQTRRLSDRTRRRRVHAASGQTGVAP